VESHIASITGAVLCEEVGTYTLFWDNSYSWLTDKNLSYLVEVSLPAAN
jgi:hypothetical protein